MDFRKVKSFLQVAGNAGTNAFRWCKDRYRTPEIPVSARMFLVQLAGALSVLIGIASWSVPCALIIGGIGAIVAVEMQGREPKQDLSEIMAIQARIRAALAEGKDPFAQEGVPFTSTWVTYAASLRRQQ